MRSLLALLSLLLMQQVGVLHRYAHAPSSGSVESFGAVVAPLQQPASGAVHLSGNDYLPAHDASQCGLLDHLFTADALVFTWVMLATAVIFAAVIARIATTRLCFVFHAFKARAPPMLLFKP